MNKRTRDKIRKHTLAVLQNVFGPPWAPELSQWIIPYGATGGTISITFWDTWLVCRLSNPIFLYPSGYTRPLAELDWPSQFTYPSGKHNLHSGRETTFEEWERDLVAHLMDLTVPGSEYRAKVEQLEFEV